MTITNFVYFFIIIFIRLFKWIELPVLLFFRTFVEHNIRKTLENIGIICELPGETKKNFDLILKSCKYDKLCRVQIPNKSVFTEVAHRGYIVLGEWYRDGKLKFTHNESDITEFFERCATNNVHHWYYNIWNSMLHYLEFDWINLQSPSRAWEVAKKHYDLGNYIN